MVQQAEFYALSEIDLDNATYTDVIGGFIAGGFSGAVLAPNSVVSQVIDTFIINSAGAVIQEKIEVTFLSADGKTGTVTYKNLETQVEVQETVVEAGVTAVASVALTLALSNPVGLLGVATGAVVGGLTAWVYNEYIEQEANQFVDFLQGEPQASLVLRDANGEQVAGGIFSDGLTADQELTFALASDAGLVSQSVNVGGFPALEPGMTVEFYNLDGVGDGDLRSTYTIYDGALVSDMAQAFGQDIENFILTPDNISNGFDRPFSGFWKDATTEQVVVNRFVEEGGKQLIFAKNTDVFSLDTDGNPDTQRVDFNLSDSLIGTNEIDVLLGTAEDNLILGREGDDGLIGDAGDDVLIGGLNNGILDGGAGDDALLGGAGFDIADYSNDPNGIVYTQENGEVTDGFGGTDSLSGIEKIIGSGENDTFTFSSDYDDDAQNIITEIDGGDGFDTVSFDVSLYDAVGEYAYLGGQILSLSDFDFTNIEDVQTNKAGRVVLDRSVDDQFYSLQAVDYSAEKAGLTIDVVGSFSQNILSFNGTTTRTQILQAETSVLFEDGTVHFIEGTETTGVRRTVGSSTSQTTGNGLSYEITTTNYNDTIDLGSFGSQATLIDYTLHFAPGLGDDVITGEESFSANLNISYRGGNDTYDLPVNGNVRISIEEEIRIEDVSEVSFAGDRLVLDMGAAGQLTLLGDVQNVEFITFQAGGRIDVTGTGIVKSGASISNIWIDGDFDNNVIEATGGDSDIRAYGGNDTLIGNEGDNELFGGTGNDTYVYALGGGDDIITDFHGVNILRLEGGIDVNALRYAQNGDDLEIRFDEGAGSIMIAGYFSGQSKVSLIEGEDETLFDISDLVTASTTGEVITGIDFGTDTLSGGLLDDVLDGGLGGNDTLIGGDGNDTYLFRGGRDVIIDTSGDYDVVEVDALFSDIISTGFDGDDFVINFFSGERITLQGQNTESGRIEVIRFSDGLELTSEEFGQIVVNPGSTDIYGSNEGDVLFGSDSDDFIQGFDGDDVLYGADGSDTLQGGNGNDRIYGGNGSDTSLDGGAGSDTIYGGDGDDFLFGDTGDDTMFGDAGNDTLIGSGGEDSLHGGTGNDFIFGSEQNDSLFGDEGNDDLFGEAGDDVLQGGDGDDDLSGGEGNDVLFGGSGIDFINGDAGDDIIFGGDDFDNLSGGEGNDVIYGGESADSIVGGAGDDILYGQADDDFLEGGAGNDTYVFAPGDGNDTIIDFEGVNTLKIDADLDPANFTYTRVNTDFGDHLQIDIASGVLIFGYFSEENTVRFIETSSGEKFEISELIEASQNTDPVAVADTFDAMDAESVSGNVLQNDMDADGDTLTVQAGTFVTANGGMVELLTDGSFTYTAAEGFSGSDTFDYTITDEFGAMDTATVTLSNINAVVEVDIAPEITPETVTVSADIEAVVDPYDFVPEPQAFPELVERARLDSDLVNGANRQNLTFNDDRNVKINFVEEGAGYKNTLGMYTVEADGTLSNVQILAENLSGTGQGVYGGGSFNAGDMLADLDVTAGTEIGFFIVANGYMKNNQYNRTDFDNGTLEFRVQNKNGDTASIDDGKTVLYFTDESGRDIKINGDIWHASSTSLNKDGEVHSVTGDLEDGKLIIGFEDLKNLGDADFNDVVIELEVSPTIDFMLDDVAIAADITIADDDDMPLTEVTIELVAGEEMGDLLTIDESLLANTNISFSQVTDTSIVLTGAEDVGAYQDIIQSLTFNNIMENPISGLRQIDITVTDADGLSDSTMISVDIGLDADQNLMAIDPADVITEYDMDPLANLLELNTPDAEPCMAKHDTAYIETRVEIVEDLVPQAVGEFG